MAGNPGHGEGWDAMKVLDLYIYDYMKKNNMPEPAEIFGRMSNIQDSPHPVIDTPGGLLAEWWSVFWETYSARMQLNSGPEAESLSVQLDNVMYSPHQSVHGKAPVVVDQPVPLGSDLDTTMMTGQHAAHSDLNPQLFVGANDQWALAQAQAQVNRQAGAQAQIQAGGSSRNPGSIKLRDVMMEVQTLQLSPKGGSNNRHGVTMGIPFTAGTTGNGASVGANQLSSKAGKKKHMMPPRTQSKNVQRNKRSPSTAGYKEDSMLGNNGEVDKPENEVVDSFLSDTDAAADDTGNSFATLHRISSVNINDNQGFSFKEVSSFRLSKAKVLCCSFSPDGMYLASAGHEKKVIICNMDSLSHEISAQGHSNIITDVRFRAVSTVFATSSFDKTVRLWNAPRSKSLLTLHGHVDQVMSVDFHPQKYDLLCSCDSNNEIRLWDAHQNDCISVFKGASRQIRFQPQTGNLLAAASGNVVSLIDIDTKMPLFKLEGHANGIRSLCWDPTGEYLASVSEDRARIWSTVGGGKCVYELVSNGNKFEACTFHPGDNQLLVIGSYQILDLWNPVKGNKTESIEAHEGIISSVAASHLTDLIASASHDHNVKIWR